MPARVGSWLAGQNQFAIFIEPDASQLEMDGKAHFLASIGETVGPADYTTFMATDKYIKENPGGDPGLDRCDLQGAEMDRVAAAGGGRQGDRSRSSRASIRKALVAAAERYRKLKIWKTTPKIEPKAIEKFQDILVQGNVLEQRQAREVRNPGADRIRQQGEVIRAGTGNRRRRSAKVELRDVGLALLRP